MPRQARIDIPGLLQHVIVRGVMQSDIFTDDQDRADFISRLRLPIRPRLSYTASAVSKATRQGEKLYREDADLQALLG